MKFQQALQATEPLLQAMKKNLRAQPKASTASLQKLLKAKPSKKEPALLVTETPLPTLSQADPQRIKKLAALREQALACIRCPHLVADRTQVVFGVGNPYAELMFVGEAPGADEDKQGEPFVGRAGQLLTKIINAMEYQRDDVFIANVLKCRPNMPPNTSGNRKPTPDEMATCLPWLIEQINLIKPRVLVALGATAVEGLLGKPPFSSQEKAKIPPSSESLDAHEGEYTKERQVIEVNGRLNKPMTMRDARGKWFDFHGIPLMVTYHPAYLLYSHSLTEKRKVWEDMLQVLEKLNRPISTKQRGYFLSQ